MIYTFPKFVSEFYIALDRPDSSNYEDDGYNSNNNNNYYYYY
jgi:hypothetical protein